MHALCLLAISVVDAGCSCVHVCVCMFAVYGTPILLCAGRGDTVSHVQALLRRFASCGSVFISTAAFASFVSNTRFLDSNSAFVCACRVMTTRTTRPFCVPPHRRDPAPLQPGLFLDFPMGKRGVQGSPQHARQPRLPWTYPRTFRPSDCFVVF